MLHQNESLEAASVAIVKAILFPVGSGGQNNSCTVVMETKTNRDHLIQEAKAACSNAIREGGLPGRDGL